jgi:hypothetical protein
MQDLAVAKFTTQNWNQPCAPEPPVRVVVSIGLARPSRTSRAGLLPARRENEAMAEVGGPQQFTIWDGELVSRDRSHGATTVIAQPCPGKVRYLLLHRAHHGGLAGEGDWA